jgi:hypothetical protein
MGLIRNGKSDDEVRQEQRDEQLHQMNLSAAGADEPMDEGYIRETIDSELQDPTVDMLSNLMSRDFLLANFSDAEIHEYRWLTRVMIKEVEAFHPNPDSLFTGEVRAAAFDDKNQNLSPLSERQKAEIEQFVMDVTARATRGKQGWQQEMYNKTITASEKREVGNDDDGGFL